MDCRHFGRPASAGTLTVRDIHTRREVRCSKRALLNSALTTACSTQLQREANYATSRTVIVVSLLCAGCATSERCASKSFMRDAGTRYFILHQGNWLTVSLRCCEANAQPEEYSIRPKNYKTTNHHNSPLVTTSLLHQLATEHGTDRRTEDYTF